MAKLTALLFAEDKAHELLLSAVCARMAREEGHSLDLRVVSARRGHGRVLEELRAFQLVLRKLAAAVPDLFVIAVDANCQRFAKARQAIGDEIEVAIRERSVIACPDPHVERWFLADRAAVQAVLGVEARVPSRKCEKDYYKRLLADTVHRAGHTSSLGGIEYAEELVAALDWYRAAKGERSLKAFLDDLRSALRRAPQ
jgi:hypothetical protein